MCWPRSPAVCCLVLRVVRRPPPLPASSPRPSSLPGAVATCWHGRGLWVTQPRRVHLRGGGSQALARGSAEMLEAPCRTGRPCFGSLCRGTERRTVLLGGFHCCRPGPTAVRRGRDYEPRGGAKGPPQPSHSGSAPAPAPSISGRPQEIPDPRPPRPAEPGVSGRSGSPPARPSCTSFRPPGLCALLRPRRGRLSRGSEPPPPSSSNSTPIRGGRLRGGDPGYPAATPWRQASCDAERGSAASGNPEEESRKQSEKAA